MAETVKTVVELEKLGVYHELNVKYIDEGLSKKWESAKFDDTGKKISFYTVSEPYDDVEPVFELTLPEADFTTINAKIKEVEEKVTKNTGDIANVKNDVEANKAAIEVINNNDTGILAQAKKYADGKDTSIKNAKEAADTAQSDVDALEVLVGTIPDGYEATTIAEYAKELADNVAANGYDDTELRGKVDKNTTAIEDLKTQKADKTTTLEGYGITNAYTKGEVDSAITTAVANADHLKREIVSVLPQTSDADENTIYMVSVESGEGNQKYEEFMLINGEFEKIGDSAVDLTSYATKTEVATAKQEAVDSAASDAKTKADKALSDAKEYTDAKDSAMEARVGVVETAIGVGGSVDLAIKEAKKAGDDASTAVTALTNGQVKTNTDAIATNATAIQGAQADATSALEKINAIKYATEDEIRSLWNKN